LRHETEEGSDDTPNIALQSRGLILGAQMSPKKNIAVARSINAYTSVAESESNFERANDYLEHIRTRFADLPETYDGFLRIMKDLYLGKISTEDATVQVSMLFGGDAELIDGFRAFL
jgi:histone deacetylase complex regulatory component SIN3